MIIVLGLSCYYYYYYYYIIIIIIINNHHHYYYYYCDNDNYKYYYKLPMYHVIGIVFSELIGNLIILKHIKTFCLFSQKNNQLKTLTTEGLRCFAG